MNLLALDASTTAVGWSRFEDGDYKDSGVFVPKGKDWWVRVRHIGLWLDGILDGSLYAGLPYGPPVTAVAYEIATGSRGNMRTNRLLGAVEYEVRCAVKRYSLPIPFVTVTASQVQRAENPNKTNIELAEQIKGAPLDGKHEGDEADAIGVGFEALKKLKLEEWEALGQENG